MGFVLLSCELRLLDLRSSNTRPTIAAIPRIDPTAIPPFSPDERPLEEGIEVLVLVVEEDAFEDEVVG